MKNLNSKIVMSPHPLLFPQLLADQKLSPGAILLDAGEGDLDSLLPLFADGSLSALTASLPCFVSGRLAHSTSTELSKALLEARCQVIAESPLRSSAQSKPIVPPAAQWLLGDWYLAPPAKVSGPRAASRTLSLKLLQLVALDADTCEIEAIFRHDPVLAYHLLRLVNSTGIGVGRTVSSFSQAILILGRQQLKRWLNLMLFAASLDDYRCAMLLAQVSVRARRMERLANAAGLDRSAQEQCFMAGMLSMLGILFGMPLADVLAPLKLNAALTNAVLYRSGELGTLLKAVACAEHADEAGLTDLLRELALTANDFNRISLEAYQWMLAIIQEKQDGADA